MAASHPVACVLSIAGSDSGGGAGIQADLKAFARMGVHGMTAITAITAQDTRAVHAVHQVPAEMILAQVRAVAADLGVDAVKIGMLGDEATITAVATALDELPREVPVVLDPVMVAESGARLLDPDAQGALVSELLPRATVATPNVPEARALAAPPDGSERADSVAGGGEQGEATALARAVQALGPRNVVITGGHRAAATDVFFDGAQIVEIEGPRHPGGAAHGSGCTHAAVLAAAMARGASALEAARTARRLAGDAVRQGLVELGAGAGPVDVIGLRGSERLS